MFSMSDFGLILSVFDVHKTWSCVKVVWDVFGWVLELFFTTGRRNSRYGCVTPVSWVIAITPPL